MKKNLLLFLLMSVLLVSCENRSAEPIINYPQPEENPTQPTTPSEPDAPTVPSGTTPIKSQYVKNGALPGVFHISETETVHFSQGNLQYNPKLNRWRFAEQQYIYTMNETYSNITTSTDNWFCRFCWGQSEYNGNNLTGSGYPSNMLSVKSIAGTNYDWGIYNPIYNGGNKAGLWFCMSADEWNYLITHHKHAYGMVENIGGVFLIPDNFVCPENIPLIIAEGEDIWPFTEYQVYTNYRYIGYQSTDNVFSATQLIWLESAGIVFLPHLGDWYMTTTGGLQYDNTVYTVGVFSNYIKWFCYGNPKNGRYPVRLVQKL